MDYNAVISQMKSMSREDIVAGIQSGSIPGWMGLSRLQEMKSMQDAGMQAPPQTSIVEERAIGMAGGGSIPYKEDGYLPKFMSNLLTGSFDYWNSPLHKYAMGLDSQVRDAFSPADTWKPEGPMYDPVSYQEEPYDPLSSMKPQQAPQQIDIPMPPEEPSPLDALSQQLQAITGAPVPAGGGYSSPDLSNIQAMLPGAIDPTEALNARRADAAEQKDSAKWQALLQFGAGLSGPGDWSSNMAEAGSGLNAVYGERMSAYHQAMQDIAKEQLASQFNNADIASRNAGVMSNVANTELGYAGLDQRGELARLEMDNSNRNQARQDAIEMAKLKEMSNRTATMERIAQIRSSSPGKKASEALKMAQQEAKDLVGGIENYESPEARMAEYNRILSERVLYWENVFGTSEDTGVTDIGDDY
jgi:hypothetical protein